MWLNINLLEGCDSEARNLVRGAKQIFLSYRKTRKARFLYVLRDSHFFGVFPPPDGGDGAERGL